MKKINNRKGQVLLIVMLVGMIALVITMGMVAQVSRLTKTVVETEEHEAAFSLSEKYSRKILQKVRDGESATAIIAALESEAADDSVSISIGGGKTLSGIVLGDSETLEIVPTLGGVVEFTVDGFSAGTQRILITAVFYDEGEYSVGKQLFIGCDQDTGNLGAITSCDGPSDTITYNSGGTEKSIRIRPVGSSALISVLSGVGDIMDKYVITATGVLGEEAGVQSETVLYVPRSKTMPTLFDFVLFNGTGQIVK